MFLLFLLNFYKSCVPWAGSRKPSKHRSQHGAFGAGHSVRGAPGLILAVGWGVPPFPPGAREVTGAREATPHGIGLHPAFPARRKAAAGCGFGRGRPHSGGRRLEGLCRASAGEGEGKGREGKEEKEGEGRGRWPGAGRQRRHR